MTDPAFLVQRRRSFAPWLVALLLLAATLASGTWRSLAATVVRSSALTPSCPTPAAGNDYTGLTLVLCNFNKADLRGAKFTNATLTAVVFDGANLGNADFSGATFADSGDLSLPTDFSFANLAYVSFKGAKFNGLTYLTYATLTCADFSNTDISTPNAVFGPSPLRIDKSSSCRAPLTRTTFANTVMNCEFIADWNVLDMTKATGLQACAAQLPGRDFSGAGLDYADLSGIDLTGTTWTGASLRRAIFTDSKLDNAKGLAGASKTLLAGAKFNHVSAKLVNFSGANLSGATFSTAELSGANFSGATLSAAPSDPLGPLGPATFEQAHLQYVNFSGATLNGVSFNSASLYGAMLLGAPQSSCQTNIQQCGTYPATGSTCSCATLANADLTGTDFSNAFLYGVDFSSANGNTKVNGTIFTGAVLVAANFTGAWFGTDPLSKPATMTGAWLQGVSGLQDVAGLGLANVSLSGAFVDFGVVNADGSARTGGNLALQLTALHTKFRDWSGSQTPCVFIENTKASSLPTNIGNMTCPDGNTYPAGCGALAPRDNSGGGTPPPPVPPSCQTPTTNSKWCAGSVSSAVGIVGWYRRQSTYENAAASTVQCNGQPQEQKW